MVGKLHREEGEGGGVSLSIFLSADFSPGWFPVHAEETPAGSLMDEREGSVR